MATVGRPRKKVSKVKAKDFEDVTVTPVANGWVVTSSTTGKNMFVFEDMDKMFDFIRIGLKPTNEQAAVLQSI